MNPKAKVALGIGAGLAGSFLVFHLANKWWIERKLRKLRDQAIAGKVPTRAFLEQAMRDGQVTDPGTGNKITVAEAARMPCSQVFSFDGSFLPGFDQALVEMRRNGTCL